MTRRLVLALALTAAAIFAFDIEAIKQEPNLEKRSDRALENAKSAMANARELYKGGDIAKVQSALDEMVASVELSQESLVQTGKTPRKSPKYFKRAELAIRDMLRKLAQLEMDFSVDDRTHVQKASHRLQEIHDELLTGIMSKGKKK